MKDFLKPSPEWDQANPLLPGSTGESQADGEAELKRVYFLAAKAVPKGS